MEHDILLASCTDCGNTQLEIFITKKSIISRCSLCDIQVFEITNMKKFFDEVKKASCVTCHRKLLSDKKLPN